MRTIYHLIQNRTTLEVICVNCANSTVLNHSYLARRFGAGKLLSELRFVRVPVERDHGFRSKLITQSGGR